MKLPKLTKSKILIATIIILLSAIRIIAATTITTFHGDEFRRAETVENILAGKESPHPTFKVANIPIFIKTDAGFSSLPFLAPAAAWSSIFGTSPTSLRIFVAIIITLSLILLAHTVSLWHKKSRKVFLLSACIALTLPWLFLQGIIFWDTSFAPIGFIIAFYAFTKLKFSKTPKTSHLLLLPLSLITSVYLYLPSAIPAVILYFTAIIYLKKTNTIQSKHLIANLAISLIASLPFIIFFLTFPDAGTRSGELSVFYQTDIFTGIGNFLNNILRLISPSFLFITGDPNLRHSTKFFGMLGTFSIIPIIWALYYGIKKILTKNERLLLLISILGIALATTSSALTHPDAQPHSLRTNAAAPFYILLITLGLQKFLERHPKATIPAYAIIAISAIAYYIAFFIIYPDIGHKYFT